MEYFPGAWLLSATSDPSPRTAVSLKAVFLVTFFSVGQLVVLFVFQLVLARQFGASAELDVFMAVQAIPLVVGSILAGSLGSVLIPQAHDLEQRHGREARETFLNRLGWVLLAGSVLLAVPLVIFPGGVVQSLFSGFTETQLELASQLLLILAWLIPINTLTSYFYGVYHSRQRFFLPAAAGLVGPFVTVWLALWLQEWGVQGIAWAVLGGGLAGILLLLPGFPRASPVHGAHVLPAFKRFALLLWPLVLGAAYIRLDPLVDRHLLAGLSEGSISQLGYASRIITAAATLATSGLSVVVFPAMARHAASGEREQLATELAHAWRFLCVVMVPCLGGIFLYSKPLVAVLLERGAFTSTDTLAVSRLMCLYAGVVVATGVGDVAARAFFVTGSTRLPPLIGTLAFTLGVIAKFLVVSRFETEGLALVTSAYLLLSTGVMLILLGMRLGRNLYRGFGLTFSRSCLCTLLALGVAWPWIHRDSAWSTLAGVLLCSCVYVAALGALRDEFVLRLWRSARGL